MATAQARTKNAETTNAIDLLKADHKEVSALFDEYEDGKDLLRAADKRALAEKICAALTVHATIEEEIFYPAAREAAKNAGDQLDEAEVEHDSVKYLIEQIEEQEPGEDLYDAKVKVLSEYVKHHVKEEQEEMFPQIEKSKMDLDKVGEQLAARKEELSSENDEDEEAGDDEEDDSNSKDDK